MMSEPAFIPFPVLQTERLLLRELTPADSRAIFQLRSNKKVSKYIRREPLTKASEADHFVEWVNSKVRSNAMLYWVICEPADNKLLGTLCLWNFSGDYTTAELGYEMLPKFQGKGFMSEAVQRVLTYGFVTLGLTTIEAHTHQDNERSTELLKKQGFLLNPLKTDEVNEDNVVFFLDNSRFKAGAPALANLIRQQG